MKSLEDCLSKIIARVAQSEYKDQSNVNFALLYFNIAQVYLALENYHFAIENLEMAFQYQRVSCNTVISIGYFGRPQ